MRTPFHARGRIWLTRPIRSRPRPGAKHIDPHEVGTDVSPPRLPADRHRRLRRRRRGGHALALHRPDEPRRLGAGARLDRGRHLVDRAGPVDHRHVARQAGLHPLPHRRRRSTAAQRGPLDELPDPLARNANLDAERAGDRREPRRGRQGAVARHGRRLHASRLRAARPAGRFRRLVLPLPRLALRHRRPHPPRARAGEHARSRPSPSSTTPRSASAEAARPAMQHDYFPTLRAEDRGSAAGSTSACRSRGSSTTASSPIRSRAT